MASPVDTSLHTERLCTTSPTCKDYRLAPVPQPSKKPKFFTLLRTPLLPLPSSIRDVFIIFGSSLRWLLICQMVFLSKPFTQIHPPALLGAERIPGTVRFSLGGQLSSTGPTDFTLGYPHKDIKYKKFSIKIGYQNTKPLLTFSNFAPDLFRGLIFTFWFFICSFAF